MANPNKVIGQGSVTIDGERFISGADIVLNPGGVAREHVEGDFATGYHNEKQMPSKLEFSRLVTAGTDLSDITDSTVVVEFDNGQTWMIVHAFLMEPGDINAKDGKVKYTLGGPAAEKVS